MQNKRDNAFGEKALFSFAVHLDRDGALSDGEVLFTTTRALVFREDAHEPDLAVALSDLREARYRRYTGSCCVEVLCGEEWTVFCRSTASDAQNLSQFARILSEVCDGVLDPRDARFTEKKSVCPACGRPLPPGSDACPRCADKKTSFRRLLSLTKPYALLLTVTILLFGVTTSLNVILPRIQSFLVDHFLQTDDPGRALTEVHTMIWVVLSMAGVRLLITLATILRGVILTKVSNRVLLDLRRRLYERIQALSVAGIARRTAGDLINRVSSDTVVISQFLSRHMPAILEQLVTLLAVGGIMFASSWKLALMILIPVPLVLVMFRLIWRRTHLLYRRQWVEHANANTVLHDIFQGVRVVKVYGTEKREIAKYDQAIKTQRDISYRNEMAWAKMMPYANFLLKIGNFILLYYVGNQILKDNMTLGQLTMFTSYVSLVYGPIRWMANVPRMIQHFSTATAKVFEVMDEDPDVADRPGAVDLKIRGQVDVKNVYFGYNENENVLENVSVSVGPGEMLGIVGRSGVGKSTLINLIMRLYDVDRGSITIDGVDVRDVTQHSLRSQIGVVLQETFLFSGSIFDNIAYAKPDATLDEVVAAARLANAHGFIMKLPDGYNTYVGERGYTLSGGERQRIAIARAILHDPRILILDEATSSLDTETERLIQDALQNLCRDRTTIAIAHRLSTLRNATKLLVLDKKTVAEVGTHEELMEKGGIYHSLVLAQREMSRMGKKGEPAPKND
ncbi:MAG: ATP-binding cassette domain-containing protein [Clostridia bacterium]|nr:ATP-binding cassette domain-containing protein [Clostridia bacterium]